MCDSPPPYDGPTDAQRRAETKARQEAIDRATPARTWLFALEHGTWDHGLRGARQLRRVILEHEERQVRAALRAGMPWWAIGGALGVSAQAAHGRWARRIARADAADRPDLCTDTDARPLRIRHE